MEMDIEDYEDHTDQFHSFSDKELTEISNNIVKWYQQNRRKLPWRGDQPPYSRTAEVKTTTKRDSKQASLTSFFSSKKQKLNNHKEDIKTYDFVNDGITPYSEYVSEIMLQQTRVDTVIDKYIQWMERFPTIADLAKATEEEVNSVWSGLGYYRRAQYLIKGAKYIVENCNGIIPNTKEELLKVPGIGEYTAGAILSIAYNTPEPAVDGNVIRVLSRLRALYQQKNNKEFLTWCKEQSSLLVSKAAPSDYTQGIMELGAVVCTPQSPSCSTCPLQNYCKAYQLSQQHKKCKKSEEMIESKECSLCCSYPKTIESVEIYPLATKSKDVPIEHYAVLLVESEKNPNYLYLHRRTEKILTNQLEPLLVPIEEMDDKKKEKTIPSLLQKKFDLPTLPVYHSTAKHVFSHRIHYLSVCSTSIQEDAMKSILDYTWWSPQQIRDVGTTSWFLLMVKTAKKAVSLYKK